ncbi:Uncharacterized protein dnm_065770 [Desulfonema magnum]|uniref:Uncharacterized protein n=1 Tax=Desulfonema magnum TaxID=45655 RepID=A0A975BRX6_9BACT|nr:Uncharacterized protein dnm_065770 [Desulfonema magnum]
MLPVRGLRFPARGFFNGFYKIFEKTCRKSDFSDRDIPSPE